MIKASVPSTMAPLLVSPGLFSSLADVNGSVLLSGKTPELSAKNGSSLKSKSEEGVEGKSLNAFDSIITNTANNRNDISLFIIFFLICPQRYKKGTNN